MANQHSGKLRLINRADGHTAVLDTINFTILPGTTLLLVIEKPEVISAKVLNKEGTEVPIRIARPPIQRILDLREFSNIVYVSDEHMQEGMIQLQQICEQQNIDEETLMPLLSMDGSQTESS